MRSAVRARSTRWRPGEAAFAAFGEQRLGPAMAELGIDAPVEPTFHPAHEASSRTP
jgi:hypothetical protein